MSGCQCKNCIKRREKAAYRRPAKPEHFKDIAGFCNICGERVFRGGAKTGTTVGRGCWHKECAEMWLIMTDANSARKHVFERDGGICATCGLASTVWDLDHIKPLINGGGFGPENMQTLCSQCHKIKTAQEAKERATSRKVNSNDPD